VFVYDLSVRCLKTVFTVSDQIWCVKVRIREVVGSDLEEFVRYRVNGDRGWRGRRERDR
jgi:hypothetical protein